MGSLTGIIRKPNKYLRQSFGTLQWILMPQLALPVAPKLVHEKNAIFSAWLMRRIGASGSDAKAAGLRTMPLAIRLEPRES
jgi:hypothetical protein